MPSAEIPNPKPSPNFMKAHFQSRELTFYASLDMLMCRQLRFSHFVIGTLCIECCPRTVGVTGAEYHCAVVITELAGYQQSN